MKFSVFTGKYDMEGGGEGRLGKAGDKDRERGAEKSQADTQIAI